MISMTLMRTTLKSGEWILTARHKIQSKSPLKIIMSILEGALADEMDYVADVFGNAPLPKKHINVIVVRQPGK